MQAQGCDGLADGWEARERQAGESLATPRELARQKSKEFLRTLNGLYNPATQPPPLPFVRKQCSEAHRRERFGALVKALLASMAAGHEVGNEDWLLSTTTYYAIREVVPLLLDALEELAATSEFVAAKRAEAAAKSADNNNNNDDDDDDRDDVDDSYGGKDGAAKQVANREVVRILMPLNFIGCYLMRHNPTHPAVIVTRSKRSKRQETAKEQCSALIHEFFAQLAAQRRMENRQELWRTDHGRAMMNLWRRYCPSDSDELALSHIRQSLPEFHKALNLDESMSAEDVFHLFDKRGTASGRALHSASISFERFEQVVGDLLRESDQTKDALSKLTKASLRGRTKVSAWVREQAMRKLERRLEEHSIDGHEWFKEYATSDGAMDIEDVRLCSRSIAHQLSLDMSNPEESKVLAVATNNRTVLGYEGFVRIVAELVNISTRRHEAEIEAKSRQVLETRMAESVKAVQGYLRQIDHEEARLAKLKRRTEQLRRSLTVISESDDNDLHKYSGDSVAADCFEPTAAQVLARIEEAEGAINELRKENARTKASIEEARRITLQEDVVGGASEDQLRKLIRATSTAIDANRARTKHASTVLADAKTLFNQRIDRRKAAAQAERQRSEEAERQRKREAAERKREARRQQEAQRAEEAAAVAAALEAVRKAKVQSEKGGPPSEKADEFAAAADQNGDEAVPDQDDPHRKGRRAVRRRKLSSERPVKGDISNAAKLGSEEELRHLFRHLPEGERAAAANEKDKNGSTPLMHVAWPGRMDCAKALLENGADPLATNLRLNTALHFAFERGHVAFAEFILARGGAPALTMRNALGKTPIDLNPSMKAQLRL